MNRDRITVRFAAYGAVVLAVLALPAGSLLRAAEHQGGKPDALSPASATFVIRIGEDLLGLLVYREIDTQRNIERTLFNSKIVGTAHTTGWLTIRPLHGNEDVAFQLQLSGQTVSRTVAELGPARVQSVRTSPFEATKEIVYDGRRVTSSPAEVEVKPSFATDEVVTKASGVRGQVVRRVVEGQLNQLRDESEKLAQRDCESVVTASFNERVDARLAHINRQLRIRRYLRIFWPEPPFLRIDLSTTDEFLQIGASSPRGSSLRPPLEQAPHGKFSLELWVHDSHLTSTWRNRLHDWPGLGALLVEQTGGEEDRPWLRLAGWGVERGLNLRFHSRGTWVVAQAGPLFRPPTAPPAAIPGPPQVELGQTEVQRR